MDDGLLLVVKVHISGRQLHALIDSGATCYYVHPKLTSNLHLKVGVVGPFFAFRVDLPLVADPRDRPR